ncbi:uncharacterized protein LOC135685186 [Rhopilema esculentum]|uniref:uncharacterized protein LOC135685186 n=1 Tax=Rhopilema esculentum TaxID=499914 RepID=UPI0031D75442
MDFKDWSCYIGFLIISSIAAVANLAETILAFSKKGKSVVRSKLIPSLGIIDLLTSTLLVGVVLASFLRTPHANEGGSNFSQVPVIILIFIQQGHVIGITWERHYATKYPFKFKILTEKITWLKVFCMLWVAPSVLGVLLVIVNFWILPSVSLTIYIGLAFGATSIYLLVAYYRIVKIKNAIGRRPDIRNEPGASQFANPIPSQQRQHEKRLVITCIAISVTYCILSLPAIVISITLTDAKITCSSFSGWMTNIAAIMFALNLLCDPLFYFWFAFYKVKLQATPVVNIGIFTLQNGAANTLDDIQLQSSSI